jgi:hypothetical protein
MSEAVTEAPPAETQPPAPEGQPAEADTTDWKAEARKWEQRAKDNNKARLQLEETQRAAMTEAERAVAEAEAKGRQSAQADYGQRLAKSEFAAAAARRNPDFKIGDVLDDLNLGRFLGEDGEPDTKAIEKAVERFVPAASASPPPPMDLGERRPAQVGPDMNQAIRRAAGRA